MTFSKGCKLSRCLPILLHEERKRSSFWYIVLFENNGLGANFRNSVIPSTFLKFHICILSLKNHFACIMLNRVIIYTDMKTWFFPYFPHSQWKADLQYKCHSPVRKFVARLSATISLQMLLLPKITKMCLYILRSRSEITRMVFLSTIWMHNDRLCGLVVRVLGYTSRGSGFYSQRYQPFWEVVGLERGPLGLISTTRSYLERKVVAQI
jgi:hypothetical protein